ncbi:hypothetical protein EV356DRAFT_499822 [Viridothelium virens]|uniref:Coenzyme Q-binding protein COQ10 START domain-containing protein n=1 Tax=Viridothelium virens TaxID=1048519 RepID=A0A6A6HND6_VIRVR|nr:hypothetical protein EV356DRAFT_499822 [Viridothelium virens]
MTSTTTAEPDPTNDDISTTPPSNHTLPSDCLFSPFASTTINAPASHVAKCLLDSARYPEWNTFIPEVTITYDPTTKAKDAVVGKEVAPKGFFKVGTKMTFRCEMNGKDGGSSYNNKEEVTRVEMPPPPSISSSASSPSASGAEEKVYNIEWDSRGFPSFVMRGKRMNQLRRILPAGGGEGGEKCEYVTWETFAGPLARVVKMQFEGLLRERFVDWTRDLKAFAERTWAEREG